MKLHELDALNRQDKASKVLEQRLGKTIAFEKLSLQESCLMLKRVSNLINEHRASAKFHSSETDPAYLKLIMIAEGLKGRISENVVPPAPTATTPPKPGQPAQAGQPAVAVDPKDPKVQAAMKKSQSGQTLNPDEQKLVGAIANASMQKESRFARRRLRESEIQQAQVVLAAQDMVDQIQKMLEQISAMQFKDLPALTDSIKNDMGVDQATAYQSAAAAALTQLLQSVQQGKTALEGAQGSLTGQAPVVPGEEDTGADDMGAGLDAEIPAGDEEAVDELPPPDEEEPTPLGAPDALGRERRGVEEGIGKTLAHGVGKAVKAVAPKWVEKQVKKYDDADKAKKKASVDKFLSGTQKVKEGAKPDFLDMDKDGDKKEPMKKAVADKKKNPFAKAK